MTTNQVLVNRSTPGTGQELTNKQRRTFIGGALAALLASPGRVLAEDTDTPNNPFILLLTGLYHPVVHGPKLGLSSVNLDDGSYSTTKIYPVFGVPDSKNEDKQDDRAIGNFYVSLKTGLCAYQLPGGAIAMQFTGGSFQMIIPDGSGGQYDEGTFELTILEATGIYSAFQGGHNHMVDRLRQLVAGAPFTGFPLSGYNEFCFCIISQYPFP
jgi:hypothetical protein